MPDIAIIGGGVAGLTAGLYAARAGAETIVYEELFVGGQAAKTHRIENYPGFPEGLDGFAIGTLIEKQARKFGLTVSTHSVTAIDLVRRCLNIGATSVSAEAIILCMGASPRKLGLPREEALVGRGVSYCATCDGSFFKNQDVAIIGGGDTALSDALYLARFCNTVTIVHRRSTLRASVALQKAAQEHKNIHFAFNTICTALLGEDMLSGLMVKNVQTSEEREFPVSGVFIAVGVEPRTALVRDQVELAFDGAIITNGRMETSLQGVYAAGDVRDTPLRQIVTACADGALAATEAVMFLAVKES